VLVTTAACGDGGKDDNLFGSGGSGSASVTDGVTTGSAGSTGASSGASSAGTTTATSGSTSSGDPKFDVGGGMTAGTDGGTVNDCDCPEPSPKHYIWVANSAEGTVSKIDTITVVEEGRYRTHPSSGDPSRTSVNISGRAMAVANRNGGITKIWANAEDCTDTNGNGTIDTSTGAGDVKAWMADECVAWHRPLSYTTNRPVAWTCFDGGEKVWTAGANMGNPMNPAIGEVVLLDGDTGDVLNMVTVSEFKGLNLGPYGGAVDAEGSFWIVPNGIEGGFTGGNVAAKVRKDMTYEVVAIPAEITSYGVTVDAQNNLWVTSYGSVGAARYNVATQQWQTVAGFKSQSGIMQGQDLRLWVGTGTQGGSDGPIGVYAIDPATMTLSSLIPMSGNEVKGISVDPEGFVWAVNQTPGVASKIDAATMTITATYTGLDGPYTYSDMTGWGIQNTTGCKPPPQG
jgi:hypothetical protein